MTVKNNFRSVIIFFKITSAIFMIDSHSPDKGFVYNGMK